MNMRLILIVPLMLIALTGCSQNLKNGYYWDNYSQTQYAYLKNATPQTLEKHIETLEKIVSVSNRRGLRVPPGIYTELAFMTRLHNPEADISEYLDLEVGVYPEAAKFVDFVNVNLFGGSEVQDGE